MPLEPSVVDIDDLNPVWPAPADPKSDGDDHIRELKRALLNDFPGFTGAVMVGGASSGAVNAYTLSPATPLAAYAANTMVLWKPHITNDNAVVTLNASSLGPRAIKSASGAALLPGDLVAGQYVAMVDTGAEYRLIGITKNYIDRLAFSSMLPTPPATTDQVYLGYQNGTFAYLQNPVPDFLIQAQGIV